MLRPIVNKVCCKNCDDIIESIFTYDFKTYKGGIEKKSIKKEKRI
ncbi:DUF7695 domain-containing protein [Niallia nealsonii]|nr:hypothetical protein [Niallia nealsonii]